MNLTEMLLILTSQNLDNLRIMRDPNTNSTLVDLDDFRQAFNAIRDIPGLRVYTQSMEKFDVFRTEMDTLIVTADQSGKIVQTSSLLYFAASTLRDTLREVVPPLSEGAIRVKLPDPTDYKSLLQDQQTLSKALGFLIYTENIKGEIRIVGWENGSLWLTLFLGGIAGVTVVGAAAWAAAVIRKKWIEGDILVEKVKAIGAETSFLEHISEKAKIASTNLVNLEATALFDNCDQGGNKTEQIGRNKEALLLFADLLHRGAEIHPALMEPEKASNLFPNYSALDMISSKVLQLPDSPKQGE